MSHVDVVRYWKDPQFRASLTPEERSAYPDNPAGPIELADHELEGVQGGILWLTVLLSFCWDTLCSCGCTSGLECGFQSAKVC